MQCLKKKFLIKTVNKRDAEMYKKHSTFHSGDAGLDLFIINDVTIGPKDTVLVDLGVKCQCRSVTLSPFNWIKSGFYKYHSYMLFPRSSISKTPLIMRNSIGLIDRDYTGTLKAPLYNTSNYPFEIKRGQRYLQLVNADLTDARFTLVDNHRKTTRAEGGFGSTGVAQN
jgi:dUTP pyrophosphatase